MANAHHNTVTRARKQACGAVLFRVGLGFIGQGKSMAICCVVQIDAARQGVVVQVQGNSAALGIGGDFLVHIGQQVNGAVLAAGLRRIDGCLQGCEFFFANEAKQSAVQPRHIACVAQQVIVMVRAVVVGNGFGQVRGVIHAPGGVLPFQLRSLGKGDFTGVGADIHIAGADIALHLGGFFHGEAGVALHKSYATPLCGIVADGAILGSYTVVGVGVIFPCVTPLVADIDRAAIAACGVAVNNSAAIDRHMAAPHKQCAAVGARRIVGDAAAVDLSLPVGVDVQRTALGTGMVAVKRVILQRKVADQILISVGVIIKIARCGDNAAVGTGAVARKAAVFYRDIFRVGVWLSFIVNGDILQPTVRIQHAAAAGGAVVGKGAVRQLDGIAGTGIDDAAQITCVVAAAVVFKRGVVYSQIHTVPHAQCTAVAGGCLVAGKSDGLFFRAQDLHDIVVIFQIAVVIGIAGAAAVFHVDSAAVAGSTVVGKGAALMHGQGGVIGLDVVAAGHTHSAAIGRTVVGKVTVPHFHRAAVAVQRAATVGGLVFSKLAASNCKLRTIVPLRTDCAAGAALVILKGIIFQLHTAAGHKDGAAAGVIFADVAGNVAFKVCIRNGQVVGVGGINRAACVQLGLVARKDTVADGDTAVAQVQSAAVAGALGLVAGKGNTVKQDGVVLTLALVGKIDRAARRVSGIVLERAAVNQRFGRCTVVCFVINAVKNCAAPGIRVVAGKGVGLVGVRLAVLPRCAKGVYAVLNAKVVQHIHRTAAAGRGVVCKGVGGKGAYRIAVQVNCAAAGPGHFAGVCRGAVAGKGVAVQRDLHTDSARVAALFPGCHCAAGEGRAVAGKGAALNMQAGRMICGKGAGMVHLKQHRAAVAVQAVVVGGFVALKGRVGDIVVGGPFLALFYHIGVIHCAAADGTVIGKGAGIQRVLHNALVKGNRAAARHGGVIRKGCVLDFVVCQTVELRIKGQRAALAVGSVLGKLCAAQAVAVLAAAEHNGDLHLDSLGLDFQVVLVGEVERAAVHGRVVAVKHNTVRQGKGHAGTQVDSAAIVGRIVSGKGCAGQCNNSRIVGIQRRATAVGDAVFDAACALHGKVCVHVLAVGILDLFDFVVAGIVLDRCTIAIQHDIKAAIAVDGGRALNIHARAGACIMEPANGGILQSQAAAQRHLRATGGGAVIRCLDGAVLDGEFAKHRYADCRIIGHSQRRAVHIKSNGFAGVVDSELGTVLVGTQKGAIGDDQSARVGVVSFSSHRYICFGGTGLEHSCVDQRLQRVG